MARLNYLYKLLWNIEIGKPAVGGGRMWNPRSLRPLPSPFRETDVTVTRDLKLALQYQAIISIFQYFIARELRVLCVRSDDQIRGISSVEIVLIVELLMSLRW